MSFPEVAMLDAKYGFGLHNKRFERTSSGKMPIRLVGWLKDALIFP